MNKEPVPMTSESAAKELRDKVPQWSTAWPPWFGIHGNVTVVPKSDYDALFAILERAQPLSAVENSSRTQENRAGAASLGAGFKASDSAALEISASDSPSRRLPNNPVRGEPEKAREGK